jgi:hypothetical protein
VHDQVEGVQAGKQSVTLTAATGSALVPVVFPRPYTVAPIVVVSVAAGSGVWAVCPSVTTTGFNIQLRAPASVTTTADVNWVAVGTPA